MNFRIWTITGGVLGVALSWFASRELGSALDNFFWNIKGELFGGLFTMAGLLLSVKTYIVVKLQEGVYSRPLYIEDYVTLSEERKTPDSCHLDPLFRLSTALTTAVAVSAAAAILQLAAAAVGSPYRAILGFGSASAALGALAFCWYQLRANLEAYFKYLRKESEKEVSAARDLYRRKSENLPKLSDVEDG